MTFKVLDLFSGIGGFSLGLERTGGFETVSFCEVNEFCSRILKKHWPKIPNLGDITKLPGVKPMSCAGVSHAKTLVTQADAPALPENVLVSGRGYAEPFAWYDRSTRLWRTWQRCLETGWTPLLGIWPKSGMTRNGIAYQLKPLERHIAGIESGSWPTPTTADYYTDNLKSSQQREGSMHSVNLSQAVKMWPTVTRTANQLCSSMQKRYKHPIVPTPTARDYRSGMALETVDGRQEESSRGVNLSEFVQREERNNGKLNPPWVEWLMGYPIGWTESPPSETP